MLGEQSQKGGFCDALLTSQCRTHLASLVASNQLRKFVCREAIGQAVALSLANWLWRSRPGLTRVYPFHGGSDGRHLVDFEAGAVRVTS